jgi:N-acetyl-anhydromuramyl-L-alanine amidase AmpD
MNKEDILKFLTSWFDGEKEKIANQLGAMSSDEPDREPAKFPPETKKLTIIDGPKMPTRGQFKNGGPKGAIIHFTASRYDKGIKSAFEVAEYGITQGHAYWLIARDGTVVKTHDLKDWGYHAGNAYHKDLGFDVSRQTLGIEVLSAGPLNLKLETYFGTQVPLAESREIVEPRYKTEQPGIYHAFTSLQEDALVDLLVYLKKTTPTFNTELILAHSEVCQPPGRKEDPGGCLSMGMPKLRELVKSRV